MKPGRSLQQLTFYSKLERLSDEANYFAFSVPVKVSRALGVRGPVPVSAKVNDSEAFLVSLHPVGEGRHKLRVKAKIRDQAKIKEGDRARVQITVLDRSAEVSLPKDLVSALRVEGVLEDFKSLPRGKRSYTLRWIDEAAKPETRTKRIQAAVEEAHRRREKNIDQPD